MSFAVIRVDQPDGEYVEGVECIYVSPTEQEADDYLQKMKNDRNTVWENRMDYIEKFVDDINLPAAPGYQDWIEYTKQYHPFGCCYVMPKDFKKELKGYLRTHYSAKIEGYSPPDLQDHQWEPLFVVEVK
jgi:hypothetical protein